MLVVGVKAVGGEVGRIGVVEEGVQGCECGRFEEGGEKGAGGLIEGCVDRDGEEGREERCCGEGEKGEWSAGVSMVFDGLEGFRESYLRRKCGTR